MTSCRHELQRLQWGWVRGEMGVGCSGYAPGLILHPALTPGESGKREPCNPNQVSEPLCLPWQGE